MIKAWSTAGKEEEEIRKKSGPSDGTLLASTVELPLSLYLYTCIYTGRNERNHSSGTEDRNGRWSGLVIFLVYSRAAWSRERILGRFWWSRLECSLRCSSVGNFLLKLLAYWVFGKYVHFRINIYIYIGRVGYRTPYKRKSSFWRDGRDSFGDRIVGWYFSAKVLSFEDILNRLWILNTCLLLVFLYFVT